MPSESCLARLSRSMSKAGGQFAEQAFVVRLHGRLLAGIEAQHAFLLQARQFGPEDMDVVGPLLRFGARTEAGRSVIRPAFSRRSQ